MHKRRRDLSPIKREAIRSLGNSRGGGVGVFFNVWDGVWSPEWGEEVVRQEVRPTTSLPRIIRLK